MYKVTVGIPIYNVCEYIEVCLISALNQDFEDIEYILVDGCGTDASMHLALKLIQEHKRKADVRIIKQEKNLGPGEDRNAIIRNCNTEYLYFLDSDDEMAPNCISLLYAEIVKDHDIDFVNGCNSIINLNGDTTIPPSKYGIYSNRKDILNAYLARDISGVMWNKLYSTRFLLKNNILTIHSMLSEDVGFQLQEMYYSKKIVVIPQVTYWYYRRKVSLTSDTQSYLTKRAVVLIDLYQIVLKRELGRECEIILLEYILMLLYDLGTTAISVRAYMELQIKIYNLVLKSCHINYILKGEAQVSRKIKCCAISALIPNNRIRLCYLLLLSQVGKAKRVMKTKLNSWLKF